MLRCQMQMVKIASVVLLRVHQQLAIIVIYPQDPILHALKNLLLVVPLLMVHCRTMLTVNVEIVTAKMKSMVDIAFQKGVYAKRNLVQLENIPMLRARVSVNLARSVNGLI